MEFVWLLLGLVVGAAAVWFWLDRKSSQHLAEVEAGWDKRLRHAFDEVKNADLAHEETKQRLITSEMALRGHEDRVRQREAELAQARQAAEQAQALGARLDAACTEARSESDRLKQELAAALERARGLEVRLAAAERELATATGRAGELDRRLGELETRLSRALPEAATAPRAAEVPAALRGLDGKQQRLRAIDARLAMLPAGSTARAALLAEKARLLGTSVEPRATPGAPDTRPP